MSILAGSCEKEAALKGNTFKILLCYCSVVFKGAILFKSSLNSKMYNSVWLTGTDSAISFFQCCIVIIREITFETEPFLKFPQVINFTIYSGGTYPSLTVLRRIQSSVVDIFLLL